MVVSTVELRNIAGTEAALGWAASHTVVVDRPDGKAGGGGIGFNGAQLLGLAIGGCYCNDLRYVSHDMGREIGEIAVSVTINLDGIPLIASKAEVTVRVQMVDGSDPAQVIEEAWRVCTVANSLAQGLSVSLTRG
ncbi:OsmC family protein [Rhizobium grahamii]|uniref:Oxidoreductase n=1 Tax=Rhizobium grahamii TaxID=1120045 RepID=A0A370KH10_9HYPH|nr:OsmC family protein [Rhizobium grahamii]RDJ04212.1 oxidoreductase [Rhizobium grahamii]